MLKTFVRTTTCLAVSAAALIAVTKLDASRGGAIEVGPARRRGDQGGRAGEADPTPKQPKQPPPKLTMASLSMPASATPAAAPAALPSTARTDADSTLTVPDWKGKRLSVARREARKLGLNVTAFDEEGERVRADQRRATASAGMLTKAGTAVQPGADVEVRVREVSTPRSGY